MDLGKRICTHPGNGSTLGCPSNGDRIILLGSSLTFDAAIMDRRHTLEPSLTYKLKVCNGSELHP